METKKLSLAEVKNMNLAELQAIDSKGLSAPVKQAINVRIAHLTATESDPTEKTQEQIAQDSVTKPTEAAPIAFVPRNKPGETTYTIVAFKDDTKGIRANDMVTFLENNKPGAKVLTGQVQRLFAFFAKDRQEAKIMVTAANGSKTRYYRFEKDITPVAKPAPAEEVPAT